MLKLAISPCPNDTFAFWRLVHDGGFDVLLEDVEELNARAERGDADVTKISVAAYPHIAEQYALLYSGGAAGFGVGPLVVGREPGPVRGPVAIPGERTTAALLLRQLGSFETVAMRFDKIEAAVLAGDAAAGVLIHEGRFTFADRGLHQLADLGAVWEERTNSALPLGAIAIRRDLGLDVAEEIDASIRASVETAFRDPAAPMDYVRTHAQEMAPDVVRRHIELYVNEYTKALDERAVERLIQFGREQGVFPPGSQPVFAYERNVTS